MASDCQSAVCQGGSCQAPTCSDGVKNGGESDQDCGGSCTKCVAGKLCQSAADCNSQVCAGGVCQSPTCTDNAKNGSETGKDCGGGVCGVCPVGEGCASNGDCQNSSCIAGLCNDPSCTDGLKNGGETDIDCGGTCGKCATGSICSAHSDCTGGFCSNGVCVSNDVGCADGQREGFLGFANIAACSGGWSVAGVKGAGGQTAVCNRVSGDDSSNPAGVGCSVADLCQIGWHVCDSSNDVATSAGVGSACAQGGFASNTFFITRQSGPGNADCSPNGVNDLFGCGTLGGPTKATCAPLDKVGTCSAFGSPWSGCLSSPPAATMSEATLVKKTGPDKGGALCCRDPG